AALYYLPLFERNGETRPASSGAGGSGPSSSASPSAWPRARTPPMFVLDSNRLAPYQEAADQFDNRYLARVPPASALREAGYRRVLYVRPVGQSPEQLRELDDLNDDFVAYRDAGV